MSWEAPGREVRSVLIAAGRFVLELEFWMLVDGEMTWVAVSICFGLLEALERG